MLSCDGIVDMTSGTFGRSQYNWPDCANFLYVLTDTVRPKNQPIDQNVTLTFADNTFHLIGSMLPWAYPLSPLERLLRALFSSKPGQN
jgi:hypothetical protein